MKRILLLLLLSLGLIGSTYASEKDATLARECIEKIKEIDEHIDDMGAKMSSPLLEVPNSENTKCWPGKVKVGTKMSSTNPGVKVNDCKDPKDI